jgi:chromosome segregation ATPase
MKRLPDVHMMSDKMVEEVCEMKNKKVHSQLREEDGKIKMDVTLREYGNGTGKIVAGSKKFTKVLDRYAIQCQEERIAELQYQNEAHIERTKRMEKRVVRLEGKVEELEEENRILKERIAKAEEENRILKERIAKAMEWMGQMFSTVGKSMVEKLTEFFSDIM